jgi:IS605 OrfB family transposase
MILTKTVRVKLETSISSVMPTIKAYTEAFNHICTIGWKDNDHNAVSLHNKTYKYCRTLLPSQLSCSVRNKASEALKSTKTRKKKKLKASCPQSKQSSIRYDANSYNVWFDKNILSVSTVDGRKKFGFKTPPNFSKYKDWRRKSAELFVRGNKVFLGIVFQKEMEDQKPTEKVVGIDRGIKKIAVTSENQFFEGGHTKQVINRYRSLRKRLQSKGTRSAKRHLRKLRLKENRFRRDVNHRVSKQIVDTLPKGTTLVLEDLKNIRDISKKFRKEQKYWINGWSFFQLEQFLSYKAAEKGCFVDFVDARYTSQKCSVCGHTERGNRIKQSLFKCKHCGFQLNADLNASRNICNNYRDAKGYPCRAFVSKPIVTR